MGSARKLQHRQPSQWKQRQSNYQIRLQATSTTKVRTLLGQDLAIIRNKADDRLVVCQLAPYTTRSGSADLNL